MEKLIILVSILFIGKVGFTQHEHNNTSEVTTDTKKKPASPRLSAMAMIANNHVHIDYGSPSVRGRSIWNCLVAYDQVWATGAHKATWIDFSNDVKVKGVLIPKGKYGFYTIPGKNEWILIINKTWDMHLADDYNAENDIIRINAKPNKNKSIVESLTYHVIDLGKNKGQIKMSWEKLNVSFDFENTK